MCLGVPGRVVEWIDCDIVFGRAMIEFGGVSRVCQMACVPDAQVGDYVVVHAGIAISRIDPDAARQLLDELSPDELRRNEFVQDDPDKQAIEDNGGPEPS